MATKRNNRTMRRWKLLSQSRNKRERKKLKSMIQMMKCKFLKRRARIRSSNLMNKSLKWRYPRKRRVKKRRKRKISHKTQMSKKASKKSQQLKWNKANNKTRKEQKVP